ncbi:hypothetical protein SGL43_07168 [Streptomyces globisporus]|uniref:Uncharacterized protein n=1 Tax=Streptomyces globisporus TaxID=1908 RepID=A0ABN8VB99_STRGL|nr:hypothetical protein SGL43_07168 [Streptomyces globisporus]
MHPLNTWLDFGQNTVEHLICAFSGILHIHILTPSPGTPRQ